MIPKANPVSTWAADTPARLSLSLYAHFALAICLILGGCSTPTLKDDMQKPLPSVAEAPATKGILAELAA